ncbi:hypothetical protein EPA93_09845 [Ktedonosporobacter rubrisoli]|uniref:Uncharacterized protein n=1 Tax=Ktedonosporobacter rubrisoli TaxID=2509675 RepID=A0A4P6JMD6_KTERU|nr:hypothetical protein [Ktedonosporobacter rubrisoli]QBD76293.1 hypothetical protein EPA93_09845 [Ktedonosporobacter rubrisoli]
MSPQNIPLETTLRKLRACEAEWKQYENALITHAQRQAITEQFYEDLLKLFKNCIELLEQVTEGEVVTSEWCSRRDACVRQIQEYII